MNFSVKAEHGRCVIPALGRQRQEKPWGLLASLAESVSSRLTVLSEKNGNRGRCLPWNLATTYSSMQDTHIHTYTSTQNYILPYTLKYAVFVFGDGAHVISHFILEEEAKRKAMADSINGHFLRC